MTGAGALWLALVALFLGGLLSALHMALADLRRGVLEELAERGAQPAASARVKLILEDVPGHVRAVALPRMLCSLFVAAAVIWWLLKLTKPDEAGFGRFMLGALVAALVLWVSSVLAAMSIARHAGERLVYRCSGLLRALYIVEIPIAPLARALDRLVVRITGGRPEGSGELEAELRSVIDEGERGGRIDQVERDMLESVIEFRTTTVEQIMTPRTEVEALEYTNEVGKVTAMIREVGHSRIPVYQGDLDHVVGVFYVKDLMKWLAGETGGTRCAGAGGGGRGFELKSILRPAIFVPETKTVRELLRELMQKKVHIAIVADEFGGTAGIVTVEDIIEEVFGEIQDEYEPAKEAITRPSINIEDRAADLDARSYLYDINEALRPLGVALPESGDYDTLGGFVITTLGRIPAKGESFRHERVLVNVLEASPTRVLKVRLKVTPPEDQTQAAAIGAAPRRAQSADGAGAGRG